MRLYSFVAAAALASASLVAHADTITQEFTTTSNTVASFTPGTFNPADGTLNSVTLGIQGTYTYRTLSDSSFNFILQYGGIFSAVPAGGSRDPGTHQVIPFSVQGDDAVTLMEAVNGGELGFGVLTGQPASDNLTLSLSYNYTPAAPVAATPEPSSLALLGTGLLGVVGVMRKRFA